MNLSKYLEKIISIRIIIKTTVCLKTIKGQNRRRGEY
jgi:hypothetical protein